jgi:hypothetical protein
MMSKTRLLTLILVAFVLLLPVLVQADLTSGLVAHWSFDNCDATDDSGNGHNGTIYGSPQCVDSVQGKALRFNGYDDYIEVPDNPLQKPSAVTIAVWVQVKDFQSLSGSGYSFESIIFKKNSRDTNFEGYEVGLSKSSKTFYGEVTSSGGLQMGVVSNNPLINLNQWYHVAVTADSNNIAVYVNGELKETKITGFQLDYGTRPLFIGRTGEWCEGYFNGVLDEVRIYNRALTEAEIQALYRTYSDGLVAYYPFNGNANDESGNGNNGTVYGATLTSDRFGNTDSAYSFDGLDDYIEVPNDPSLNPSAVTVSAWFKTHSYGSPGWCNFPTLIFKQSPKDVDNTYYVIALLNDYQGWPIGCLSSGTWSVSGPNVYVWSQQPLPLDEWHHVVATMNSTEVREYIDGQLQGVSSTGFPLDPGSRPLYIGYTGMFCGAYWNGLIDEVRIYNRALSEAEIEELYSESSGLNKFTICQVQHNGDYDPDPGSLDNLVAEIKSRTGHDDISSSFVNLDSVPSCSMLYITGHYPFSFTENQRANLEAYLENGGFIFADDWIITLMVRDLRQVLGMRYKIFWDRI